MSDTPDQDLRTLAGLVAYIEARFPCATGLPVSLCQTGEPYVVLGTPVEWKFNASDPPPGVLPEGAEGILAYDEETACLAALVAFQAYAEDKTGTLYWRAPAVLRWDARHKRCRIYLRLVITDKPVIFPTLESYDASRLTITLAGQPPIATVGVTPRDARAATLTFLQECTAEPIAPPKQGA